MYFVIFETVAEVGTVLYGPFADYESADTWATLNSKGDEYEVIRPKSPFSL